MTTTATPLTAAELPLVLLACVAHPRADYREDLRRRLHAAIDARKPAHPVRSLEAFFARQARRRGGAMRYPTMLRQLAVLVTRLAFSGVAFDAEKRLLIAPDDDHVVLGCVVTDDLKVITLARSALIRHRASKRPVDCRFLPELAAKRLRRLPGTSCGVTAVCRVEDRLVLELTDEAPWPGNFVAVRPGGGKQELSPAAMGFGQRRCGHKIRLTPQTPEATLRFTAWLAEGRGLILEHDREEPSPYNWSRSPPRRRRIGVRMRDFDGDRTTLPVVSACSPDEIEPWLTDVPALGMTLSVDDRVALASWAYPLANWLTDSFVERLL